MKHLKPFNESNYEREKRTFSKEQANSILYDEGIYDDNGDTLYSVVESNVTYTDQEKNRVEYSIVIKEESTGKFFSGCLADSPWWKQAEANAEEEKSKMKHLKTYKIFEKSKPGTSVAEINDLLADLSDNGFYIEVNIDHGPNNEETIDDGSIRLDQNFNIVILTQYLMYSDPLSEDEDEEDSNDKIQFSWNQISDSVIQVINFLTDRYNLKRCKVNAVVPDKKGKMDNFIFSAIYDKLEDGKLPVTDPSNTYESLTKRPLTTETDIKYIDVDKKNICNVCIEFETKNK